MFYAVNRYKMRLIIPFIKPEHLKTAKPYMLLMEKLGNWPVCLPRGGQPMLSRLNIWGGEIAELEFGSLTNTFIKGLLRPYLHDAINYVMHL